MMTHPLVARRRALRLATLGLPVVDLTCGLGGDLRAIAHAGLETVGSTAQQQPRYSPTPTSPGQHRRADASVATDATRTRAVKLDPSRRGSSGRRFDPGAFSPTWTAALQLLEGSVAGVMKAPPGIDHSAHPRPAPKSSSSSSGAQCAKPLCGSARVRPAGLRRAVLLRGTGAPAFELDSLAPRVGRVHSRPSLCVRPRIVRYPRGPRAAARTTAFDSGNTVTMLDPPDRLPHGRQRGVRPALRQRSRCSKSSRFPSRGSKRRLRERGWRADEVRRRGFPVEPDELLRQLGKMEGERVALLLTTLAARRAVIVARQVYESAPSQTRTVDSPRQ